MENEINLPLKEFKAIGIGPIIPRYNPPSKSKVVPPVERKDPTKKSDNQKDKEKKSS